MTGRRIRLAPALVVPVLNAIVLTNHTDQDIVLTDVRPLDVADATVEEVFVTTIPVLADGTHEVPGVNGPWPRPGRTSGWTAPPSTTLTSCPATS